LGLEEDAIGISSSSPAAQKRLILANGILHELPGSFLSIFKRQKLFSKPLVVPLIQELLKPKFKLDPDADISVHEFISQRLGHELAEYLSDPMCRGIIAGDCRKISLRSLFPDVYRKSLARGSIVKGMLLEKASPLPHGLCIEKGQTAKRAAAEKWIGWSLKDGLQQFPQRLTHRLSQCHEDVQLLTSTLISKISFAEKKAIVTISDGSASDQKLESCDVFSCLPANQLAACIEHDVHLKKCLSEINFVDVAVACLEFEGKDSLPANAGFGFLTPSFEKSSVLGVTFDSCCFPHHDAGQNITRVTCMMGGEWFPHLFPNHTDDQLLAIAEEAVRKTLAFKSRLLRSSFRLHRNCIPQYHLNHHKRVEDIRSRVSSQCENFFLLGSSYEGVSVNDVIMNARRAVHEFGNKQL
jgi:oxygen-dependent protoporphyrinogen oxidase